MGMFSKIKSAVSGVDAAGIDNALLGRGVITSVQPTGTVVTVGTIEQHLCQIQVEIALDGQTPYTAVCRQRMPVWTMAQTQPGSTTVAVRVDADDQSRFAIDWDTPAPTVRLAQGAGNGSAAEVLATGLGCSVIVQQFQPLGMTNAAGVPLYAFALTVVPTTGNPYQVQVGNPVPNEAIALCFPGSRLPAKVLASNPEGIVIDWAAAGAVVAI